MTVFEISLGLTGSALLLAIAVMMSRRGLRREYPFFFSYIVFTLVLAIIFTPLEGYPKLYFYSYWISEIFSAILGLLALHEAFYEVFYAFYVFWWFRLVFPSVVGVISFISIWYALLHPMSRVPTWVEVVFALASAVGYIRGTVFLVFMILVVALRMRWRRYPYDIVLGFAVSSVGVVTSYILWETFGVKYAAAARLVPPLTYLAASVIWLWTFSAKFQPEPGMEWKHELAPEQLLQQTKDYIEILKKSAGRSNEL